MISKCANCEWVGEPLFGLEEIVDLLDRIEPGGTVPSGECRECDCLCYPVDNSPAKFAKVLWSIEDVKTLRPSWSDEKCEEELGMCEKYLVSGMIERGWSVLECLLSTE